MAKSNAKLTSTSVVQGSRSTNHQFDSLPQPGKRQASFPNRKIPAWLLSCLFHSLIFAFALLSLRAVSNGAAEDDFRDAGIVLVSEDDLVTEYISDGEIEQSSARQTAASPPPLPVEQERAPDLPGFESSTVAVTGIGDDLIESLQGADGLLNDSGSVGDIGGKITTEVFGVKGTGSRFVYVFDRSASMSGYNNKPLRAAKKQLLTSLQSLGKTISFRSFSTMTKRGSLILNTADPK